MAFKLLFMQSIEIYVYSVWCYFNAEFWKDGAFRVPDAKVFRIYTWMGVSDIWNVSKTSC